MKKKIIIMAILVVLALIALIIMLAGIKKLPKSQIVGTWTTDGVTIYKFNKDNTGELIVSLKNYPFTYKIKNDILEIDFENERSTDSKYTYSFEENKLILKGDNGTFTFIRK